MGRLLTILIIASTLLLQPHFSFCQEEFTPKLLYNISGYEGAGTFQQIYSLQVDWDFERIIILNGAPLKISVFSLLNGAPLLDIVVFKDAKPPYSAFGCGRFVYFSHAEGIERFGEDGNQDKWKAPAAFPKGADKIACGRGGDMAFLLRKSNVVDKYDMDGKLQFSVHPKDSERRERREPEIISIADICIGPGGGLYVADAGAGVVHRYDANGKYTGTTGGDRELAKTRIDDPQLVAVDSARNVWIYDGGGSKVKVFDSFGFHLGEWDAIADDGTQDFISPAALFVDRYDHLFMFDEGTMQILVFDVRDVF
ncbi:MAG: hypothetical protein ABIH66_10285 [bacterium]